MTWPFFCRAGSGPAALLRIRGVRRRVLRRQRLGGGARRRCVAQKLVLECAPHSQNATGGSAAPALAAPHRVFRVSLPAVPPFSPPTGSGTRPAGGAEEEASDEGDGLSSLLGSSSGDEGGSSGSDEESEDSPSRAISAPTGAGNSSAAAAAYGASRQLALADGTEVADGTGARGQRGAARAQAGEDVPRLRSIHEVLRTDADGDDAIWRAPFLKLAGALKSASLCRWA